METQDKTIEELRKEAEEYLNGWKRAKADFVNYQKQVERERAEWFMFANAACVKAILPVVDALQGAVAQFTVDSSQFTDGIKRIQDQMVEVLKQMGVEAIAVTKEPLNPELHEVVGVEKVENVASGLMAREVQRGYTMHGKVLRVAKVIIAE